MLLFCLVGASWALWPHVNRPVSDVSFTGTLERVDRDKLRILVEQQTQGGLLTLNIDDLDQSVESLEWVYAAEVQKTWPQRLVIQVEEEQPVARWGNEGYLAASGKMVSSAAFSDLETLPLFDVAVAQPDSALELFYGLNAAMLTEGIGIDELHQSQFGSWSMVTEQGNKIVLGKDDLITRVKRVMRVWARLSPSYIDQLEAVDARYPNGIAVKYREEIVHKNEQVNGGFKA